MTQVSDFLSRDELTSKGFKSICENVQISRGATFYNPERISIGDNCRIDTLVVITAGIGGIDIGRNVHIAACAVLLGSGGAIRLEDFSGVSVRGTIFTTTDDFTGACLTGPTIPETFKNLAVGDVTLRKHCILGASSVVLPGVEIGLASTVGALSLVKSDVGEFLVVAGVPAREIGKRSAAILDVEKRYLSGDPRMD